MSSVRIEREWLTLAKCRESNTFVKKVTYKCKMIFFCLQIFIITNVVALVSAASVNNNDQSNKDTIQMIQIIFRHGDRTPRDEYPNDPYINYEWPGGLGALTKKGSLQHFNLGGKLSRRYRGLLPTDGQYSKNDIYVKSSDFERCIMSAQSFMAGFLPPKKYENYLSINWQPVPVQSTPRYLDHLIFQLRPCTKYDNLLQKLLHNPPDDMKKMNEENIDLFDYLREHSGMNITTGWDIVSLCNVLDIQNSNGLILPEWTKSVFPDKLIPFQKRVYALFTETEFMKKIKSGGLITEVYKNMISKANNSLTPNRKMFVYSGHDITVLSVIRGLGIENQTTSLPDYASTLVFELHKTYASEDGLEVKLVFYENSEVNKPKIINIPGCDSPCSLVKFGEVVKNLIYDNYDELCENEDPIKIPPVPSFEL